MNLTSTGVYVGYDYTILEFSIDIQYSVKTVIKYVRNMHNKSIKVKVVNIARIWHKRNFSKVENVK